MKRKVLGVGLPEAFLASIDPENSISNAVPEKGSLSFPLFKSFLRICRVHAVLPPETLFVSLEVPVLAVPLAVG